MKHRIATLIACLACCPWASAHHSFAMYDQSRTVTVKGTVKAFQWTNPHVMAIVEAEASGSEPAKTWRFELASPGNLTLAGWTKRSLNPGDVVAVDCNPLRDGRPGASVVRITLADGKVLSFKFQDLEKSGLE